MRIYKRKEHRLELVTILEKTKEYLDNYDNISWDGLSPAEAAMDLAIAINALHVNEEINRQHLELLFAPTGLIQDCAMVNDWHDDFIRLSSKFDSLIGGF